MSVFEKHTSENRAQAKAALVGVAATIIGKYVIAQERLNSELSGGNVPGGKDEPCLECKVLRLTRIMTKLDGQVGQIVKTYELMFDEEMDIKAITKAAIEKFYPLLPGEPTEFVPTSTIERIFSKVSRSTTSEGGIEFPEGTPQEVRDIASLIQSSLSKRGKNIEVKVVDIFGEDTFGVDPKDYPTFKSFWEAVKTAKKAAKSESTSTSSKPSSSDVSEGTDSTKPASAHVVEETSSSAKPSSNGSQSTKNSKDSSKDSPKK